MANQKDIHLYTAPTSNGWKPIIFLEEAGIKYDITSIDFAKKEQKAPEYLKLNPNGRIPTIIDRSNNNFVVFESGAILWYLAEKYNRFLPKNSDDKSLTLQWLMFQMANLGPICGQAHHFRDAAIERVPYAITRFTEEAGRLYGVMDRQLSRTKFLAGELYTIADMACWPWGRGHRYHGQLWDNYSYVKRWFDEISVRPAVQQGMKLLSDYRRKPNEVLNETTRDILFGSSQMQRR